MTEKEMLQVIREYIWLNKYDKDSNSNLLINKNYSFIIKWKEAGQDLGLAIKNTVLSAQGGKTEALSRMKRFAGYLQQKGYTVEIDWPPIDDIGNRYERIIYILRATQSMKQPDKQKGETVASLIADRLWMNERSIEDDFSYMSPPEDQLAPKTLFQQSLAINGLTRKKGAVDYVSTAHPVFLIENMKSVLVMIEALLEKATQPAHREQAMVTTRRIWKQLTPYAQDRITKFIFETYTDEATEIQLFRNMKQTIETETNLFMTEDDTSTSIIGKLIDCMKREQACTIEYLEEGWNSATWHGIIRGCYIQQHDVLVIEEENLSIPFDQIIKITLDKDETEFH